MQGDNTAGLTTEDAVHTVGRRLLLKGQRGKAVTTLQKQMRGVEFIRKARV